MNYLDSIFISIGGTTTTLIVGVFLLKKFMTLLFDEQIEEYKAKLSYDYAVAIEKTRIELLQNSKNEERQYEYDEIMKNYYGPLLHAIYDLQSRLFNIVAKGLIDSYYLSENKRKQSYVVKHTSYLIGQYFSLTEIVRNDINFIELSNSDKSKKLSELQGKIYALWQTDSFHDVCMFWAGEQRAIGELMIKQHNNILTCIGYATYLKKIESEEILSQLSSDIENLCNNAKICYPRLIAIQHALIDLLDFLDPDFVRFPKERRSYLPQYT